MLSTQLLKKSPRTQMGLSKTKSLLFDPNAAMKRSEPYMWLGYPPRGKLQRIQLTTPKRLASAMLADVLRGGFFLRLDSSVVIPDLSVVTHKLSQGWWEPGRYLKRKLSLQTPSLPPPPTLLLNMGVQSGQPRAI